MSPRHSTAPRGSVTRRRRTLAQRAADEAAVLAGIQWIIAQPRGPLPPARPPTALDERLFTTTVVGWQHAADRDRARREAVREASRAVTRGYRSFTTRCAICQATLEAQRATRRTCSDRCRQRLARGRRRENPTTT
jgi:hypothetical protein